jgi:CheY-like chemotaxis protein/HPt (histidine-containing phosphotransfer) domain-containing protein
MSRFTRPEERLRTHFLSSAVRRVEELRSCLEQLSSDPTTGASLVDAAARQLHMLKGDAKLLGFDAIHAAAEELEEHIRRAEAGEGRISLSNGIHAGVATLESVVQAGQWAGGDDAEAEGAPASADGTPATDGAPSGATAVAQRGVRPDGQPWRILLIDDSEIALEVQRSVLHEAGFEVRATTSLGTFDELLEDWCPQVILADVDMPTLSGPELCRTLKGRYDTAHVPIVLCSALATERLRQLARDCEAEGYVSKARLESLADDLGELCEAMAW